MITGDKIKLVIWDLDDTFWDGTLSEGEVKSVKLNIDLIKRLTDIGIVNAICSKNDDMAAKKRLEEMGVLSYFVFNSINWEPKGERIREMLQDMKLRAENVLFLDDNQANLEEAAYYNQGMMTASPEELDELWEYACKRYEEVKNAGLLKQKRDRLEQYRLLEQKREARKGSSSNEDFLAESNIKVTLAQDCGSQLDRISELVSRTNQLNFTKVRSSREEIEALLTEEGVQSGYVTVEDKYGSYGIVGFYALRDGRLEHFLFSCRTLGMGVEQYVYAALGFPELDIRGDVAGELKRDVSPSWINQEKELHTVGRQAFCETEGRKRILFKGPCDLDGIFSYLEENESMESEFTYVNQKTGVTIESISHTSHIVQALTLTGEQKELLGRLPFGDEGMYSDRLFHGNYDVVCLSILVDANLGVYRRRKGGELVAFAEAYHPVTEPSNWESYEKQEFYSAGCKLNRQFLEEFSAEYEYMGALPPEETVSNLRFIREHLPENTLMLILLGSELRYEKNTFPAYENRHLVHRELNRQVKELAAQVPNMVCIDVNRYLKGQESFYDHLNHYVPSVYYELSAEIVRLVNGHTGQQISEKPKKYLWMQNVKAPLKKAKKLIKKVIK